MRPITFSIESRSPLPRVVLGVYPEAWGVSLFYLDDEGKANIVPYVVNMEFSWNAVPGDDAKLKVVRSVVFSARVKDPTHHMHAEHLKSVEVLKATGIGVSYAES